MMEEKLGFVDEKKMGMLTDLYELTMAASYFENGMQDVKATFDLFFRKLPKNRNYLVLAGLEQVMGYLSRLKFTDESIRYLAGIGFKDDFLEHLRKLRFQGDVWSVEEGRLLFQSEPVIRVTAPIIQSQIIETFLLNSINLQTTIASKASRVVDAAKGRPVIEFGLRRTQGYGGVLVARAAFVGGCRGTSNVLAGMEFGIPVFGTMAHSYVLAFDSEAEAFRSFARTFPDSTTLLIDTFDNLKGAENALRIAKEMEKKGNRLKAVRLDSGDFTELSKKVRKILDRNGLKYVRIFASGNLNEHKIDDMLKNGAKIDSFGVGTEMSVSSDSPSLDVVYKLSEVEQKGRSKPRMKFSEGKETLPGKKQVFRKAKDGKYSEDVIALEDERVSGEPLLKEFVRRGKLVRKLPKLEEIRSRALSEVGRLKPEYRDLRAKHHYPVRISPGLEKLMAELRKAHQKA
jgi:nicotinate phosphoribosyltransferase